MIGCRIIAGNSVKEGGHIIRGRQEREESVQHTKADVMMDGISCKLIKDTLKAA